MLFSAKKKENLRLKIAAVVALVLTIAVNALANILPINGITSGEVSDSYPNLFAPIGFTFSIWSIIYTLLIAFSVYQFRTFRSKKSRIHEDTLNKILPYFIATSVLNSAWILFWHYNVIGASVVLIILILVCLARISNALKQVQYNGRDQLFVKTPFSIYYGWVTVATVANITTWLVGTGWDGLGFTDAFWVSVVLVVALIIGLIKAEKNNDPIYLGVFAWAYFGILAKHITPSGFDEAYPLVIAVLLGSLGVILYRLYLFRDVIRRYFP